MSAGSKPTGQVHPRSLALLEREGIATEGLFSKSWDYLPATPDIVITTGTEEEINAAFTQAYRSLREGIETFLSLPLDDLQQNSSAFRTKLDYIGILKFKQSQAK